MHLPTLRNLQYLVSVHDCHHFGAAAKICFVSQSTLSTGIQNLEETLGVTLIERDNKNLVFTTVGLDVVRQAREILAATRDLITTAETASKPFSAALRLGVIPTIAPFLLPKILKLWRRRYPPLKVFIQEEKTDSIIEGLRNGELDLGLLALPYKLPNLVSRVLGKDRFLLAFHKNSQLVKNGSNLRYEELPKESLLLLQDGHCLRDHALSACQLEGSVKINTFSANSLHTLVEMLKNDLGITFLPQVAINAGLITNTEIVTQEPDTQAYREIGLVWRPNSTRAEEFKVLSNLIKDEIF